MPEEHTKDPRAKMLRIRKRVNDVKAAIDKATPDLIVSENYEEMARLRDLLKSVEATEATIQECIAEDMNEKDYESFVKALNNQEAIKIGYEIGEEIDEASCHKMTVVFDQIEDGGVVFTFEDRDSIRLRNQDMHVIKHILNSIL